MPTTKPYLLHLLMQRTLWVSEHVNARAERNGYGDVTPAMSRMFALIGGRSLPLSDLARQLAVTRQAIHKLATEAARLGYVEFVDSRVDARVKHVQFTAKGRAMSRAAERELIQIEEALAERLGTGQLQALKDALARSWAEGE